MWNIILQAPTTNKTIRKISSFVYFLPIVIVALLTYIFWEKMPPAVQNSFEKLSGGGNAFGFSSSGTSGQATSASDDVWDGSMAKKRANKRRA
jgi:hypothetical protein